jgi:hypothetical protein
MIAVLLLSKAFAGALICNDGTQSPTCDVCSSGCCSSHGGCTYTDIEKIGPSVYIVHAPSTEQVGTGGRVFKITRSYTNRDTYNFGQEYTDQYFEPLEERLALERAQAQAAYDLSQREAQMEAAASVWRSIVERVGDDNARMWLRFGTKSEACVVVAEASIVVKTSTGALLLLHKDKRAILILPEQSEFPDALATYNQLAAIRAPICNEGEQ